MYPLSGGTIQSIVMALSKNTYVAILCLAFSYSVFRSYMNLLDEPTTFEESISHEVASLPSITFCNRQWSEDNFKTFEDVMNAIEETKKNHFVRVQHTGRGLGSKGFYYVLTNATILQTKLNLTFEEVWNFAPHMQSEWPECLIICTTLNLPFITSPPDQGMYEFLMIIDDKTGGGHYVEKHEPGQSLMNFNFDPLQNFEIYHIGKGYTEMPITIQTSSLKKKNYDCYEDNSMQLTSCINEFIAEQLNCNLPWTTTNQGEYENCNGADKMDQFRNLTRYIASPENKLDITRKGCFKPNCIKRKWKRIYSETYSASIFSWASPNKTYVVFTLSDTAFTLMKEEIKLADFSTFMADCGSYLGLFLGASILSLSEIGVTLAKRLKKATRYRKKSHQDLI